jgi:manganese/zinc/iron transport system permease protein
MWQYFTDPVLRAPTIGCMLMCMAAALIGVVVFLRRQSLLGESLSHCTYPGVLLGVLVCGFVPHLENDVFLSICIMIGAFVTALMGLACISFLERKMKVYSDAALCFVLSAFFGIGLTLASRLQFTHTNLYRQVQSYLFGQAATMTDINVLIYGILALVVIVTIAFTYKELQVLTLDRQYAKSMGIPVRFLDGVITVLVVLAVIIGIRSVGVVLMSAMLIAPPVAARQYTNHFLKMFILSALFGIASGFLGNVFSVEISRYLSEYYPQIRLSIPTGPMIVIVAALFCLISLLLAPERGLLIRLARIAQFKYKCAEENILKAMWKQGDQAHLSFAQIMEHQSGTAWYQSRVLRTIIQKKWIQESDDKFQLTSEGYQKASHIVRLHRLWEVYLANYLGVGVEKVHRNAEEMEHIITPELEGRLTQLLNDPKKDPHQQPIPPKISREDIVT